MKKVIWKDGALVSLKLRDDLYTIGQMLPSPVMRFFDVWNKNGIWHEIVLNQEKTLFSLFIGRVVLQRLVDSKIKDPSVVRSDDPPQKVWIKPYLNFNGGFPFKGGRLIDTGPDGRIDTTVATVLKENLAFPQDSEVIKNTELTNMWGAEDLGERLINYFDTGVDRNLLKEKIFPETS